jgi:hypothetical protein
MHSANVFRIAFLIVAALCFLGAALAGPFNSPAPWPYNPRLTALGLFFLTLSMWPG